MEKVESLEGGAGGKQEVDEIASYVEEMKQVRFLSAFLTLKGPCTRFEVEHMSYN